MDELITEETIELSETSLAKLVEEVRRVPTQRIRRAVSVPVVIIPTWIGLTVYLDGLSTSASVWPCLITAFVLCFLGIQYWRTAERKATGAVEMLASYRIVKTIGPLLKSLDGCGSRSRKAAQSALLELLPRVTEADMGLLTAREQEILTASLYGSSGELAYASLFALSGIGDGTALPYLTSIAAGKGVPQALTNRKPEVQELAQYAVAAIRRRIDVQNRAGVLLRAAELPGTISAQLVRPVGASSDYDFDDLLRPTANTPGVDVSDTAVESSNDAELGNYEVANDHQPEEKET